MRRDEIAFELRAVWSNYPSFKGSEGIINNWFQEFQFDDYDAFKKAIWEAVRSETKGFCPGIGAVRKYIPRTASKAENQAKGMKLRLTRNKCRRKARKGLVPVLHDHPGGKTISWEPRKDCVLVGGYNIEGEIIPKYMDKVDFTCSVLGDDCFQQSCGIGSDQKRWLQVVRAVMDDPEKRKWWKDRKELLFERAYNIWSKQNERRTTSEGH